MAIKPKSRAHEERIKALEERVAALSQSVIDIDSEFYVFKLSRAYKKSTRRWWQFWK